MRPRSSGDSRSTWTRALRRTSAGSRRNKEERRQYFGNRVSRVPLLISVVPHLISPLYRCKRKRLMKSKLACIVLIVLCLVSTPIKTFAQDIAKNDVEVVSGGKAYKSYLTAPSSAGPHPAIVLVHSNRGLEEGYRTMSDKLAAEGFVVLAVGWQTFQQSV